VTNESMAMAERLAVILREGDMALTLVRGGSDAGDERLRRALRTVQQEARRLGGRRRVRQVRE
jgi:hypothetical protein